MTYVQPLIFLLRARSNHTTHSPMPGSSSLGPGASPQGYGSMAESSSLRKRASLDGVADGGGMRNGYGSGGLAHIRSLSVSEPKNTRSSEYYQEDLGPSHGSIAAGSNGVFGSVNGGGSAGFGPSAAAESREDDSLLYHEGENRGGGGALGASRMMRLFK